MELSIEEKAKAYDEAIERAKKVLLDCTSEEQKVVEYITLELKESEGEKIRKEIIAILKYKYEHYPKDPKYSNAPQWIAWLENQGENKPTDKVEPKFKVGQTIKKEGFNLGFTIVKTEDGFYYNDMGDYFPFTDQDNWELVEQKSAWSEEEEKKRKKIIHLMEAQNYFDGAKNEFITPYKEECDWLKSLRPQNTWKPSEEQMRVLDLAIRCGINRGTTEETTLVSLFNNLKKLMEE